ncbi:MAG: hypothetical protein ACXVEF_23110 [Polyangiales bacterium]
MTPSLAAVHDDLVAAAAKLADVVHEIRERFEARVGAFEASDPWFEERSAALWDRVLIDPRVIAVLASDVAGFASAQRGLFEVHGRHDLTCVLRGAAFRLASSDDAAIAEGAGWIDGHVVKTREGVALLPGFLVHPAEATEPMREIVAATSLPFEDLLDELLAMRHRLASRSRMKAKQVYRMRS